MDFAALRLFVHLSRSLHYGRTSRECGVSPSALSRVVQRLEAELGEQLFSRDQRSVALTRQGELFQAYAVDALARFDATRSELASKAERLSGRIAIFASVTACQSFLPRILNRFRNAQPDVQIRLETGYAQDALEMLGRGAVDVAVAALPRRVPASLLGRVIVQTELVFVAPALACPASLLIDKRPIPWKEVPIVLPSAGLSRDSAERWFKRRGVTPLVYGEVPGNEAILALVSLGCGVGIVPRIVVERSPLRMDLRLLEIEPSLGGFQVGICAERTRARTPIVRALWDSLDEPA